MMKEFISVVFVASAFANVNCWDLGDPAIEATTEWFSIYADGGTETLIPRDLSTIMNFQPAMDIPDNAFDVSTNCPHQLPNLVDWDDASFSPAPDGSDILLPTNTKIIIRAGMLLEGIYGKITIPSSSSLVFDDPVQGETISLNTLAIVVDGGTLEAGSPTCRIGGKIEIILHGDFNNTSDSDRYLAEAAESDPSIKAILVKDTPGSKWDFHGKLYHPTWTRLAAHVPGNAVAETTAPSIRNSVLFLQDCVNWPAGGEILVTTSHIKDTRAYHFNEEATITEVRCVEVQGKQFGEVTLSSPLEHYHHAGEREYQCEVALLTRNIVIMGNEKSEPTDNNGPLECPSTRNGWSTMPCPGIFLTGFGGHTIIMHQAEGRLRGVEFFRMGQTNILGRYPVHFHHSTTGTLGTIEDCSIHRSYYRAITVHHTFDLLVSRNTAFDIIGYAYYLEAGTEERNRLEYNLGAFVHEIDGTVLMGSTEPGSSQTGVYGAP